MNIQQDMIEDLLQVYHWLESVFLFEEVDGNCQ